MRPLLGPCSGGATRLPVYGGGIHFLSVPYTLGAGPSVLRELDMVLQVLIFLKCTEGSHRMQVASPPVCITCEAIVTETSAFFEKGTWGGLTPFSTPRKSAAREFRGPS